MNQTGMHGGLNSADKRTQGVHVQKEKSDGKTDEIMLYDDFAW